MTEEVQPATAKWPEFVDATRLDDAGCVEDDALCVYCDYNLRTLPVGGLCPECGKPVAESVRSGLLKYAAAEWVDGRLVQGVDFLADGLRVCLIGGAVAALGSIIGALGGGWPFAILFVLGILYGAFGLLPTVGGLLMCTTPEPDVQTRRASRTPARLTRWYTGAAVFLPVLFAGAAALHAYWLSLILIPIWGLVILVALPRTVLQHVADLLRRVPDTALAETLTAKARPLVRLGLLTLPLDALAVWGGSGWADVPVIACFVGYGLLLWRVCAILQQAQVVLRSTLAATQASGHAAVARPGQADRPGRRGAP
jgi:hypothetical protein